MRTPLLPGLACVAILLSAVAFAPPLPAPGAPAPPETEPHVEPLQHKGYTETLPGSEVRFDMVAVPGGTFLMGSPTKEDDRGEDEGPPHPFKVRPFWMGKCEVTWDEFDLFTKGWAESDAKNEAALAKDPSAVTRPTPPYIDETYGYGREGYPVLAMSHHAAMEYCHWLSVTTGKAYRLPTEAEWEFACRAGTRTAYFFGDDPAGLDEYAWFATNSDDGTHPVGKKQPNPWGLHDLYGNVAEWCLDHYQRDYYGTFPADRLTPSPVKLPTADRYPHVVRGGSWADGAARCRSAARRASDKNWNKADPDRPQSIWRVVNADFVGFRVVRAVEEQENLKGLRSKVTKKSE
jgi:formylglycine-generating enzyme required for sulfatase activity